MVDGNSGKERSAQDLLGMNNGDPDDGVASTAAALGGAPRASSPDGHATIQRLQDSDSATRYEIVGEFARGGQGAILRVWDRDLRRMLAMKVVLGQGELEKGDSRSVDDRTIGRFVEEAQVTGQLDHPGIVPVHEIGLDSEGQVFFTMRLVKGDDLAKVFGFLREGKHGWTETRLLRVFLKVCEAMAYAHSKEVIHRDLKPANIMVGRFGEVYVMDWGLAHVSGMEDKRDLRLQEASVGLSLSRVRTDRREESGGNSPLLTMDGDVVGTPAFMSPEQARGDIAAMGPTSDVYSMGAILYHLLAGHMPYAPPGSRLTAHTAWGLVQNGPPPDLHVIAKDAPLELIAICEKAMSRDIADRYQDMQEIGAEIQAYLDGRVVQAHDTSFRKSFAKLVKRNRGMAAAVGTLILFAITATFVFVRQQNHTIATVRAAQARTEEARDTALENEELATRQTYVANLIAADVSLRSNEIQAAKRRLEGCPAELRGWEWQHLKRKTDTALAVLDHDDAVTCVAFARDGSRMATGSASALVRVWDTRTQDLLLTLEEHDGAITALAFSPDGTHIASASEDEIIRIWDLEHEGSSVTLPSHDGSVTSVAFSPNGSQLISGSSDETIKIWDVRSAHVSDTLEGHDGSVTGIAMTPDGKLLVSTADDGSVCVWDAQTHELSGERITERETSIASLAISSDSSLVAFGGHDAGIHVWSLDSREQVFVLTGHSAPVTSVAFTFDGRRLVSGSLDETVRIWDVASREQVAILKGHDDGVASVATNEDGTRILSAGRDATARLWDPVVCDSFLALDCGEEHATSIAASPDGTLIAAGSDYPRGVMVWDAASGAEILSVRGVEDDRVAAVAFAPDGSWIVTGGFQDPALHVLDTRTGAVRLGPLSGHLSSITSLAVSPDGAQIVSGSDDGTAAVWDAASGEQLAKLEDDGLSILSVAFSPDGRSIATGSMDGKICLWSPEGELQRTLGQHSEAVSSLAFDAVSGRLVSGSDDETIRIWDIGGTSEPLELSGHTGPVVSVALSPDGIRVLSGSSDASLRLWDATTGESLLVLRGHQSPVTSVAFGGDGERVFSASFDRTLRIWETNPAPLRHCAWTAANLVANMLEQLGDSAGGAQPMERAQQQLRANTSLDEDVRGEALRILEIRGGY